MADFLTSNRWLKASGVSISCEEKMRQIARGLLGKNLQGGVAPLLFRLSSGGEEILRVHPSYQLPIEYTDLCILGTNTTILRHLSK